MYETTNWKIEKEFITSANIIRCKVVRDITKYPKDAKDIETKLWNLAFDKKLEELHREGLKLRINEMEGHGCLWAKKPTDENYTEVMVPNYQYRFINYCLEDQIIELERTAYSEIEALKSKEYRQLFEKEGLPIPHGPLAPALYIKTADGYIAATKRGKGTNKYPGGIYGMGGDIDDPDLTIGEHTIKREAIEELKRFGGLSQQPMALGIVFDKVLRKHDIPIITGCDCAYKMIKKGEKYLADIDSIIQIPMREKELADYILKNFVNNLDHSDRIWIDKPIPACSAGLFLLGKYVYGNDWAQEVIKQLPQNK